MVAQRFPDENKINEDVAYNSYFSFIDFKIKNKELVADYAIKKEIIYLTDAKLSYNTQSVVYSNFYSSNVKLDAFAFYPKKKEGKFSKKKVKLFYKNTITAEGIFYEDYIKQYCYYPKLTKGSKSVLNFNCTFNDPMLTPRLLFNSELYAKEIEFKINVPDYLKINLVFYGDSSGIIKEAVKTSTSTLYTYKAYHRPAIIVEKDASGIMYYTPHLVAVPVSYVDNGLEIKLGGNVPNLFNRYVKSIAEMQRSDNAEVNKIADSLTKNIKDTAQKIIAIYNYVQTSIKYIAFEEAKGGFVPRPADKVFLNKYGDCKDKANLLVNMLDHVGVKAYRAWIGTRRRPYTYEQMPSPHADDHMISATFYKGKWIFLDATSNHSEFGFPSSFIQGKEALIMLSDTQYCVQTVPVMSAQSSTKTDTVYIKINGDKIVGQGEQNVTGYFKEEYRQNIKESKNGVNVLREEIALGNNKMSLKNFNVDLDDDLTKDIKIKYDFEIQNYVQLFNNTIYLNMNLIKNYDNELIDLETRKLDYEENYKYVLLQHIQMGIPDDKQVIELPKNRSYTCDDFSFTINYENKDKKLVLNKSITINHLVLKTKKFSEWNTIIEDLTKAYKDVIILKNKN